MNSRKSFCFVAVTILALVCVSCTPGIRLNTEAAESSGVSGIYTVILYGCNFSNDLETIALLDREDDRYTFDPYAPAFKYKAKRGVPAAEALVEAENFLKCSTSFKQSQLSKIVAPDGDILGYEVRPLYYSFAYGGVDVLYTDYRIKGDKVVITIRVNPVIEEMIEGGNGETKAR
jgi:hypothetical protein